VQHHDEKKKKPRHLFLIRKYVTAFLLLSLKNDEVL
jgi:hypothetical protein